MVLSDDERRDAALRGVSIAACAVAVSAAMPAINASYTLEREEADARLRASLFASTGDGGEANRAVPNAPSLIAHPWIVRVEHSFERDSQSALGRYAARDRDRAALTALARFEPHQLSRAEIIAEEHRCLAEAVYYEARSESLSGQLAVAEVVSNRVADHRYPNSICEVVYQGATRTTGCQFTFTCDGSMALSPRGEHWERAKAVAAQVMMDVHEPRTGAATHYHASYVNPIWNSGLVKTERIGTHIFYRFPQGREWAAARARLDARRSRDASRARIQTVAADTGRQTPSLQVLEMATEATAAP